MRRLSILAILCFLIPVAIVISLCVGAAWVNPRDLIPLLLDPQNNPDRVLGSIIWNIRLPRALMGLISGMVLALAGSTLQGALRNPLVSSYTLGVSSAASFGAALAIVLGIRLVGFGPYLIIANAFSFALIASMVALGISKLKGMSSESVILAGIAMAYIFSALVTALQYIAHEWSLRVIVYWLMGDLGLASWERTIFIIPAAIACIPLLRYAWDLNALMAGEETAKSLGTDPGRTRLACVILSSFAIASVVCATGPIGFICLVTPHISRFLIGADHRYSMPGSALIGGLLLISADTASRTILAPVELPVGVTTAFIGCFFFLWLLLKSKRELWR